ncbi:MAG TPA: F0F1 ATP synthase subunit epsilon [Syntrophomonadaceae bacterium]|nr:F0F1 ATP synthase subunit epsilon [Syntrophomonadaceae bacterium]HNX28125.1 F0F1 ATP synthase subunit epsilon [Syntrophomonadaceae bacterium]HPR93472.1 F0F1 ATP synthase subunit epsilon [Syntrophomonadaceae bacterium]
MADNTFMLEIVTPEEILFKEEVQFMVAPAVEGEFGVLKNHAPLVAALKIGVLRCKDPADNEFRIAISGGFAEVVDNVTRVLAETAEHGLDIDILRAKAAKERAERRLNQRDDNINYTRAKMALQRSIARLKAAGEKVD